MVTIVVGPEGSEEEFLVYADLAKQHSKVIETSLQLASGPEKSRLRMAEHSAFNFGMFVAFIYTGRIHTIRNNATDDAEGRILTELWVTGQALQSATFKDAVVEATMERYASLKKHSSRAFSTLAVHLSTQEQTQTGIGKLLVDMAVCRRGHEVYNERPLKPECLNLYGAIITGLDNIRCGTKSGQKMKSRTMEPKTCVYHEHGAADVCHRRIFATMGSVRCAQDSMPQ